MRAPKAWQIVLFARALGFVLISASSPLTRLAADAHQQAPTAASADPDYKVRAAPAISEIEEDAKPREANPDLSTASDASGEPFDPTPEQKDEWDQTNQYPDLETDHRKEDSSSARGDQPSPEQKQAAEISAPPNSPVSEHDIEPPPKQPASTYECASRDVLGTSRVLTVGTKGGGTIGLKSYPQTLPLADHEVVLTFDDGPLPATTPRVLDVLRKNCVRATFFLIGRNAEARPDLVRRERAEGHTVGHHTWSHPSMTLRGMSDEEARADIEKGFSADEKAGWPHEASPANPHVPFFRFPGFADTKPLIDWLAARNVVVLSTDLWASDWLLMTPQAELKLTMSRLEESHGGIILLHDIRPQTVAMLPDLLAELKRNGYRIVHLVPGEGPLETRSAAPHWSSETEAVLKKIMPKLLKNWNARRTPAALPEPIDTADPLSAQ